MFVDHTRAARRSDRERNARRTRVASTMARPHLAGSKLRFTVAHVSGEVRARTRPAVRPRRTDDFKLFISSSFSSFCSGRPLIVPVLPSPPSSSPQDEDYPARELHFHTPQTRGWQCARFSKFPQELVLRLDHPARIHQIQILSHEYKIATKVELYTGLLPPGGELPGPRGDAPPRAPVLRLEPIQRASSPRAQVGARERRRRGAAPRHSQGAFYLTLVPVRPRRRGERRSLRTLLPGVSLRPHPRWFQSRRTHLDAFQLRF